MTNPAKAIFREDVRFVIGALVPLARKALNDYLARIATTEADP
jgi:hypothetical protein